MNIDATNNGSNMHISEVELEMHTYAEFAYVLSQYPDEAVKELLIQLIDVSGCDTNLVRELSIETLQSLFNNRFVVEISPLYLPATESSMKRMYEHDGQFVAGPVDGPSMSEVMECYRQFSFDPTALQGFNPLITSSRKDHLIFELFFITYLRKLQTAGSQNAGVFCDTFIDKHLRKWLPKLCSYAHARGPEDGYVQVLDALEEFVCG